MVGVVGGVLWWKEIREMELEIAGDGGRGLEVGTFVLVKEGRS